MRVSNWKAKEVFNSILDNAIENAEGIMDDVVKAAKSKCPVSEIVRQDNHKLVTLRFTPKRGQHKGTLVTFSARQFQGRKPGQLKNTIRRVVKYNKRTNLRVYAGNSNVFYAHFIERGFHDRAGKYHKGIHFLQEPFNAVKNTMVNRIKNGG